MVKVSVIVITWSPTKDRLRLLKNTLNALKTSSEIPFELIVVDNGPKEQTEYLKTQKIDKLITNEKNMGIGYARNQGMDVAEGEYICFLDNDMETYKDWLKESIEALEAYPSEKLVACPVYGVKSIKSHRRLYLGTLGKYLLWQRYGGACWVIRKNTLNEFGRWSSGFAPGRDYCTILTRAGYKFISSVEHKVRHMGKKKSFDFHCKLINGKWVNHGREYWNTIWTTDKYVSRYAFGHKRMFDEVRKYLKGKIADIACGATPLYIGGNYDVTGIDISEVAIREAKKLYPQGNFRVGKAEQTGLYSNTFDTVILSAIIEHFMDFKPVLLEAKRICKQGGSITIVIPVKNFFADHVHPIWDEEKINKEIVSVLGPVTYYKKYNKWWFVKYEKPVVEVK